MPLILGTNSIKDTGYDVANSLRFNDGSSDNLSRNTWGTPTNNKKFTISVWVKRCTNGATQQIVNSYDGSTGNDNQLKFKNTDAIELTVSTSGAEYFLKTNRLFRDVSAWYHIVFAFDSTQGTDTNRYKLYVNGTQETSFSSVSYPPQDTTYQFFNNSNANRIGIAHGGSNEPFDGYMAEFVFIDGQALTPSSFGEFDEDTPSVFKPIDVSGLTFGTNGFYLDFENSSSLGADVSGNSKNFTVNNLTSIDQSTDTCTNNFATLNPLASSTTPIFTEGNLQVQCNNLNSWNQGVPSTIVLSKGKWFWEIKNLDSTYPNYINPSFMNANYYSSLISGSGLPGNVYDSNNGFWNGLQGGGDNNNFALYRAGSSGQTIGSAFTVNHIMSFALDLDNRKCWLAHNGSYILSGNPSTGSNETWGTSDIDADTPYVPAVAYYYSSTKIGFNFGSPFYSESGGNSDGNGYGNFSMSVPSGFYAINSKNLAEYG